MPGEFEPAEEKAEEEKGCCDRICECWCQLLIIIIAIFILVAVVTNLFWW
jgi:hypothetical protein